MNRYAAVVLAAGAGRRFGGAKLLAAFDGESVLAAALRGVAASPVDLIVLVTGAHAAAVEAEAMACATTLRFAGRLRLVRAEDAASGMSASLAAGVGALLDDAGGFARTGVFVVLADMPCVPIAIFASLCSALEAGAEAAAPTWRGRRGHPVLFGQALAPGLMRATGDEGARGVLAGLGARLALVPADTDGVLLDVDRPQDLDRLRTRRRAGGPTMREAAFEVDPGPDPGVQGREPS